MPTLVFSGDYENDYTERNIFNSGPVYDVIDLSGYIGTVQNNVLWDADQGHNTPGQLCKYPLQIRNSNGDCTILGGEIRGRVSPTKNWYVIYKPQNWGESNNGTNGNSAAFFCNDWLDNVATIKNWRITDCWDGIRTTGQEFHIENCWISNANDDGWEYDHSGSRSPIDKLSGSMTNCLLEDVFVGISLEGSSGSISQQYPHNVITFTDVLCNTKARIRDDNSYVGSEMQAGAPFKFGAEAPGLIWNNCVFGCGDVTHDGPQRTARAGNKQLGGTGNYFLNLDWDGRPFPGSYETHINALENKGWTIIRDIPTAQAFWNTRRQAFVDAWNGVTTQNTPDAFDQNGWVLSNAFASSGDFLEVHSLIMPSGNGLPITDIQYRIDEGAWISSGGTGSFFIEGLPTGVEASVEIAALNAEGLGSVGPAKVATPTIPDAPAGNTVFLSGGGSSLLLGVNRPGRLL